MIDDREYDGRSLFAADREPPQYGPITREEFDRRIRAARAAELRRVEATILMGQRVIDAWKAAGWIDENGRIK